MNNTQLGEPMVPECYEDTSHTMYSYDYCFDNFDKIYYARGDDELRKDFLKLKLSEPANHTLIGDIDKEFFITDGIFQKRLQEMLLQHVSHLHEKQASSLDLIYRRDDHQHFDAWINYSEPTEFNPSHNHEGYLSFVWYLDIPEEIRQEWKKVKSNTGKRGCIQFQSQFLSGYSMTFNPKTNDLFIFNAKHRHQVYPFYSNNTRISLAGNIHGVYYE